MFRSARFRLTAWYLVIIMAVSVMFSIAIYNAATREVRRFTKIQEFRTQQIIPLPPTRNFLYRIKPEDLQESEERLKIILLLINGAIFIFAGGAAYLLAGITLKPIKKMVDEQNRFISDSSHELRTPLTSLRSEIEVALRNKKLTIVDAKKLLESNLEETISLQVLSDHLLELAQNGNIVKPKDMGLLSISEVIKTAIKKVDSQAKNKKITIENNTHNAKILGIQDRLTEVFVILLDNAIKYSDTKGKVNISSKTKPSSVEISITDHGIGIEKGDLPYIFDRFFRADKSRSQTSGYGLGLSIAKKIVESHNGHITVVSTPSEKTVFSVNFPI